MKKTNHIFIIAICILFLSVWNVFAANRIALVIGNNEYKRTPLKNPANDATDFAKTLQKYGFKVTLRLNVSNREMKIAVRAFGKELSNRTVGLFYYAGHGMQLDGRNYLIPIGGTIESEADVEFEAMDAGLILGKMNDAGNDLNIVILDACRDNPFARSFRSMSRGLARMDAPTGTIIAYATGPGSVAADGKERNSPFTKYLIDNINKSNLTIERIFKNVRISVASATANRQVPWESSSLMGDFYFNKKKQITAQPETPVKYDNLLKSEQKKLDLEKQELERQRLEIEKKRIELERNASITPRIKKTDITAMEGQYVKYETGIIFDKVIGLEWFQGPDDELDWEQAKGWIKKLRVDEKNGWRMPTQDELFSLFKKGIGSKNMTGLLSPKSWWVWCEKQRSFFSNPDVFNFYTGRKNMKYGLNRAKYNSVLAVREKSAKAKRKFEQIDPDH